MVLTPIQFMKQNPSFKKANGDFIAKKFRMEFEKLTSTHPKSKQLVQGNGQQKLLAVKKPTLLCSDGVRRSRKRRMIKMLPIRFRRFNNLGMFFRIPILRANAQAKRRIPRMFGSNDNGQRR